MSTSSSNSSLNYMSAAMPVSLPPGFANPPTPTPSTPIREFFGHNQKQRVEELEERVMELEIQNDGLKTGMHNFNVDRNEADDQIETLQEQVDDLIRLVAQLMKDAPQPVNGHDGRSPSPASDLFDDHRDAMDITTLWEFGGFDSLDAEVVSHPTPTIIYPYYRLVRPYLREELHCRCKSNKLRHVWAALERAYHIAGDWHHFIEVIRPVDEAKGIYKVFMGS